MAARYGVPADEIYTRLSKGRFRVKANVDKATADEYARDLQAVGARVAIEPASPSVVPPPLAATPAHNARPRTSSLPSPRPLTPPSRAQAQPSPRSALPPHPQSGTPRPLTSPPPGAPARSAPRPMTPSRSRSASQPLSMLQARSDTTSASGVSSLPPRPIPASPASNPPSGPHLVPRSSR